MDDPGLNDREPGPRTWVLGALLVIAIFLVVFGMIARHHGPANDTLPRVRISGASMVARLETGRASGAPRLPDGALERSES